jgi:hypothetical protein
MLHGMKSVRNYEHHISDYSNDVLVPLIGWRPRQLPD